MTKEESVIRFYVLCNKLKDVIRTGWTDWHIERERLESVAEHIYGVQMLALAMKSQYEYDIDIMKVSLMLAVHELEEIFIGDLTIFQISKEEKTKMGHQAVAQVLKGLLIEEEIEKLIYEFDERKTSEAKFAHYCDKLECDLQAKLNDEEGCIVYDEFGKIDKRHTEDNESSLHPQVKELLNSGYSWGQMWMKFWQQNAGYDENFMAVSNYAVSNNISKFKEEKYEYKKI